MKEDKYIIITWADSQGLFELDGFEENCCLINDSMEDDPESFLSRYGSSAYFVNERWIKKHMKKGNFICY